VANDVLQDLERTHVLILNPDGHYFFELVDEAKKQRIPEEWLLLTEIESEIHNNTDKNSEE
jgi:hypothetical protein